MRPILLHRRGVAECQLVAGGVRDGRPGRPGGSGSIGEPGAVLVLLEANAAVAGVDHFRGQSVDQHLEQVGPMGAVNLDALSILRWPPASNQPSVRMTELWVHPARPAARYLIAKCKSPQHADSIGMQRNSGADFLQLRRLLEDADLDAALMERIRRGDPPMPPTTMAS